MHSAVYVSYKKNVKSSSIYVRNGLKWPSFAVQPAVGKCCFSIFQFLKSCLPSFDVRVSVCPGEDPLKLIQQQAKERVNALMKNLLDMQQEEIKRYTIILGISFGRWRKNNAELTPTDQLSAYILTHKYPPSTRSAVRAGNLLPLSWRSGIINPRKKTDLKHTSTVVDQWVF